MRIRRKDFPGWPIGALRGDKLVPNVTVDDLLAALCTVEVHQRCTAPKPPRQWAAHRPAADRLRR